MQHRTDTSGALAPPTHRHRMLTSTAQWRGSNHLRHSAFFGRLRDLALLQLCPAALSQPAKQQAPASCSASALHASCSTWSQHRPSGLAPGSITSKQQACSLPAATAAAAARLGSSSQASGRGLCTSGAPGLEPAAFSGQHGLRRSVRLQAVSERGHCGEDGLVKGAGVVRLLSSSPTQPHLTAGPVNCSPPESMALHLHVALLCATPFPGGKDNLTMKAQYRPVRAAISWSWNARWYCWHVDAFLENAVLKLLWRSKAV